MGNTKHKKEREIKAALERFQGGDELYTNEAIDFSYTEGVYWLAINHFPHWFIYGIGLVCGELEPKNPFITVTLVRTRKGIDITYGDGNGNTLESKHYDTLTIPIQEIKFYYTTKTLLLPSEY